MNQTFMKERPVLPLVLSMSLPMMLSMAVNSLYNIVDSYFVAKISEDAMTALSLVFPLQNIITSIGVGFGIGINATISYYLGAKMQKKANAAACQGLLIALFHGIFLTLFFLAIAPGFLRLFTKNPTVLTMGIEYSTIVFLFSTAITIGIAFEKIFQSVGRMKTSMFSMMCGFIVNIILDPMMIFGLGPFPAMGIAGAAIATGLGQVISLLVYVGFHMFRPLPLTFSFKESPLDLPLIGRMYSIGIPAALNMALPSLLISSLNRILSGYSQAYVLILGIYYKLQTFIYLPANGIIQGIRPLVGYNFGAGEHKRVQQIYRTALLFASIIMCVGTVLCWSIPSQLMQLFTTQNTTISLGIAALRIISCGFLFSAVSVVTCGALEGLGKGIPSLMISTLRYVCLIIPAAYILSKLWGANGVWIAFPVTEVLTAISSYYIYLRIQPKCDTMA